MTHILALALNLNARFEFLHGCLKAPSVSKPLAGFEYIPTEKSAPQDSDDADGPSITQRPDQSNELHEDDEMPLVHNEAPEDAAMQDSKVVPDESRLAEEEEEAIASSSSDEDF
jgi:hypothetical protein